MAIEKQKNLLEKEQKRLKELERSTPSNLGDKIEELTEINRQIKIEKSQVEAQLQGDLKKKEQELSRVMERLEQFEERLLKIQEKLYLDK